MGANGGSSGIGKGTLEDRFENLLAKYGDDADEMFRSLTINDQMESLFNEDELEELGEKLANELVEKGKQSLADLQEIYKMMREDIQTRDQVIKQFIKEYGYQPAYNPYYDYPQRNWKTEFNRRVNSNVNDSNYTIYTKTGEYIGVNTHMGDEIPKGLRMKDIAYIRFSDGWQVRDSFRANTATSKATAAIYSSITALNAYEDRVEDILKKKYRR